MSLYFYMRLHCFESWKTNVLYYSKILKLERNWKTVKGQGNVKVSVNAPSLSHSSPCSKVHTFPQVTAPSGNTQLLCHSPLHRLQCGDLLHYRVPHLCSFPPPPDLGAPPAYYHSFCSLLFLPPCHTFCPFTLCAFPEHQFGWWVYLCPVMGLLQPALQQRATPASSHGGKNLANPCCRHRRPI